MLYELEVVMKHIEPPVWRTIQIPESATLHRLHQVLQVAMGWTNSHLYLFHVGGKAYSEPSPEWEPDVLDSTSTTLKPCLLASTRSSTTSSSPAGSRPCLRFQGPPPRAVSYSPSLVTCFLPCSSAIAIVSMIGVVRATPRAEAMALTVSRGRNWPEPALVLLTPSGMTATDPGA